MYFINTEDITQPLSVTCNRPHIEIKGIPYVLEREIHIGPSGEFLLHNITDSQEIPGGNVIIIQAEDGGEAKKMIDERNGECFHVKTTKDGCIGYIDDEGIFAKVLLDDTMILKDLRSGDRYFRMNCYIDAVGENVGNVEYKTLVHYCKD